MSRSAARTPLLILLAAFGVVALLISFQQTPEERPQHSAAPLVRTVAAAPTEVRFTVRANGSVTPRTESALIPQVSLSLIHI